LKIFIEEVCIYLPKYFNLIFIARDIVCKSYIAYSGNSSRILKVVVKYM
jgi:hypothetical protein